MKTTLNNNDDDWPCLRFATLDCRQPKAVGEFLLSLFRGDAWDADLSEMENDFEALELWQGRLLERPWLQLEAEWGYQSPMKRMGRLLWDLLNPGSDFEARFTLSLSALTADSKRCASTLPLIQRRLKEVLQNHFDSNKVGKDTGLESWGERFYLTGKLKNHVRSQLEKTNLELLEQDASYCEFTRAKLNYLVKDVCKYFPPLSQDPNRKYIGENIDAGSFIWVEDVSGRELLGCVDEPYGEIQSMTWGYPGHGPSVAARSILTDATSGNVALAKQQYVAFRDDVLLNIPQHEALELSRSEVLDWLALRGRKESDLVRYAEQLREKSKAHDNELQRLVAITKQPLKAQVFSLVPSDFEASLYVDFHNMLQKGTHLMRCAMCQGPMGAGPSTRDKHQLARWNKGLPIYHKSCGQAHRKEVNKADARERSRRKRQIIKT